MTVSPDDVIALVTASSDEAAVRAYWKLDGVVCGSGVVYEAALPTTQMILALLPSCSQPAKRYALELLGQIAAGEPDSRAPRIVRDCLGELRMACWYLLHGLQFDQVGLAWLYVDLIGILGEEYLEFRERGKAYLKCSLSRDLSEKDRELVRDTIAALA